MTVCLLNSGNSIKGFALRKEFPAEHAEKILINVAAFLCVSVSLW